MRCRNVDVTLRPCLDGNGEEKSDLKQQRKQVFSFQTWNRAPCWRKSWPMGIPCTVTVDTWSCGRLTFSHVCKTSKQKIRDVENPLNINQQTKPCPSKRRGRAPLKACEIYLPRWKCLGSLHLGQFLPWHSLWVAKMRNAPATYANPTQAERGLARNDFQSQFNKNPSYPKSDPNLCGFSTCLKSQMSVFFRICLPLFLRARFLSYIKLLHLPWRTSHAFDTSPCICCHVPLDSYSI